jgi:hypothetical protein
MYQNFNQTVCLAYYYLIYQIWSDLALFKGCINLMQNAIDDDKCQCLTHIKDIMIPVPKLGVVKKRQEKARKLLSKHQ